MLMNIGSYKQHYLFFKPMFNRVSIQLVFGFTSSLSCFIKHYHGLLCCQATAIVAQLTH